MFLPFSADFWENSGAFSLPALMQTLILLFLVAVAGGLAYLIFFKREDGALEQSEKKRLLEENAQLKAENEQKTQKLSETQANLENLRSELNQLEGKGKQIFAEITGYKEENKNLRLERDELKKKITRHESDEEQRFKEFERKTEQLENARKKLEEEQERVKREDAEKLQREKEEYDRIWNEHETMVIARLREICQLPQMAFSYYENTKLPDGFDGALKPDFLVEFLGQYIIFDAKKSKDLSTYINDQVKKTAAKIKKSPSAGDIYPVIFFVVPTQELADLKKNFFYEDGFSFYAVSPETLEALLGAYKRITEYEKISEFDPQDREKIIDLIARYDRHISFQNAANILLAQEGVKVMGSKEGIHEEIRDEVELKKRNMRAPKLSEADLKRLTQNFEEQQKDMKNLVSPKVGVNEEDLEEVQKALL